MLLSSILDERLIFCNLKEQNCKAIYEEMFRRAARSVALPSSPGELALLGAAEEMQGSILRSNGFYTPHLRCQNLSDIYILIGIPEKPLLLSPQDQMPTSLILFFLIGKETSDTYLKALSAFSKFLKDKENLDKLSVCTTPQQVMACLHDCKVMLKPQVTAEDIMQPCTPLSPEDPLSLAFDTFAKLSCCTLPVTDQDGRLLGEVDAIDIVSKFLPEYLFMMESTSFLKNFEPFDNLSKDEAKRKIGEFMRPPRKVIAPDLPLIRVTLELCRKDAFTLFVADSDGMLQGELNIKNVIHRVLRG